MSAAEIPFLGDWSERTTAYSQLEGNRSVHSFNGMLEGWSESSGLEAAVHERNLIDAGLLALLSEYRRAVCRLSCSGSDYRGVQGEWNGTGFLVAPNLLVTNNHVLNSESVAASATVDFEFERTPDELYRMSRVSLGARRQLKLDPYRLFLTSPAINGLDFTFVWIDEELTSKYATIPMSRGSFTGRPHDPVFIIHHPNGNLKQASVDDTELLNVDGDLVLYAADTEYGSSGAPVITRNGKLLALHHAFRKGQGLVHKHSNRVGTLQDGRTYTVANEGIKFSAIAIHLESQLSEAGSNQSAIRDVLAHYRDSDTVTGPFGAHGRRVESTATDPARVIHAYNATDQDVDVATWNMEWLNAHIDDASTIKRTATVFADITQDIWVLDGISRETATVLGQEFKDTFEQNYNFVFADEDTHPAQPITALFYNTKSVSVTRKPWPKDVEALWRVSGAKDLELDNLSGPIFPSFPARFDVQIKDRQPPFHLNLVPLFIGNRGNLALRREIAARFMTRIVREMTSAPDSAGDWLIVGDVNTPLRRTRLDEIEAAGLTPILAIDQQRGGFSYLRSPGSMLSKLFVPLGTERIGDDSGMVSVVPHAFQGRFVDALTGSAPYGVRLSLLDREIASDLRSAERFLNKKAVSALPQFEHAIDHWQWRGLDKFQFMAANLAQFDELISNTNSTTQPDYGSSYLPLSMVDLFVLIYCEAGFRNGVMDPDAEHSLGERGLLPLPSNLDFWIGEGAPDNNQLLSLPQNLFYYAKYLSSVKNKPARNTQFGNLYRDLFHYSGIKNNKFTQAKLMAGIIHGYFLDMNYTSGRRVDFPNLIAGYQDGRPIDQMLRRSGYIYGESSIIVNRQSNIDLAINDYRTLYN